MRNKERENAYRLAVTLSDYANNATVVARMAAILNYNAEQLEQDMRAVYTYLKSQEHEKSND